MGQLKILGLILRLVAWNLAKHKKNKFRDITKFKNIAVHTYASSDAK